jgi:hypothetical protein
MHWTWNVQQRQQQQAARTLKVGACVFSFVY